MVHGVKSRGLRLGPGTGLEPLDGPAVALWPLRTTELVLVETETAPTLRPLVSGTGLRATPEPVHDELKG